MNIGMIFTNISLLIAELPVVTSSSGGNAAAAATDAVVDAATAPANSFFSSITQLLLFAGIGVFAYFVMIRQPRKEAKRKQALRSSIKVGDNVVTNAGLFAKIVEIGTDSFVVEFGSNRGVRVPILKEAVMEVREPNLEPMQSIE